MRGRARAIFLKGRSAGLAATMSPQVGEVLVTPWVSIDQRFV
jgi:hypothetical protein